MLFYFLFPGNQFLALLKLSLVLGSGGHVSHVGGDDEKVRDTHVLLGREAGHVRVTTAPQISGRLPENNNGRNESNVASKGERGRGEEEWNMHKHTTSLQLLEFHPAVWEHCLPCYNCLSEKAEKVWQCQKWTNQEKNQHGVHVAHKVIFACDDTLQRHWTYYCSELIMNLSKFCWTFSYKALSTAKLHWKASFIIWKRGEGGRRGGAMWLKCYQVTHKLWLCKKKRDAQWHTFIW